MEQILTVGQMRYAEKRSDELGVSLAQLMDNAGEALGRYVLKCCISNGIHSCLILAGKGNNGGDFVGYIYLNVGAECNTNGLTTRANTNWWDRFRPTTTTTTRTTTRAANTTNQTLPNGSTTSGAITTTPAPGTAPYTTGTYVVNTGSSHLNIRSSPDANTTIIGKIPGNTRINITQVNGNWGRVTYDGNTGWVSLDWCVKQ